MSDYKSNGRGGEAENGGQPGQSDYSKYSGILSLRQVQLVFVWKNLRELRRIVFHADLPSPVYDARSGLEVDADTAMTAIVNREMETLFVRGEDIAAIIGRRSDPPSDKEMYLDRLKQALSQGRNGHAATGKGSLEKLAESAAPAKGKYLSP